MAKTHLMVVGGFLGAGKTTSILAMARLFLGMGKKIGIVTNDQGSQLVDTTFLASQGLSVLEVTGGCFCCNFDEFTNKVNQLTSLEMPDIILAEPVGSCTDLIATIFKPLQVHYTQQFVLCPLSVVADPRRVKKLMMEQEASPFPNEINYLFRKQLEEADIIILNKVDMLPAGEVESILTFLKDTFHGVDIIPVSAREGLHVDQWALTALNGSSALHNIQEIDYAVYARAEEYLGWLNSTVRLTAAHAIDVNGVVETFLQNMQYHLQDKQYEIAHLKVYGVAEDDWSKASLTSTHDTIDFNRRMGKAAPQATLIINARIHIDPTELQPLVEASLLSTIQQWKVDMQEIKTECFKPGKPNPKYRMTEPLA